VFDKAYINENGDTIHVNVSSERKFKSLTVQNFSTQQVVDVSHLLLGNSTEEEVSIEALLLGQAYLSGIYAIEVCQEEEKGDCALPPACQTAIVANLAPYQECLLKNLLNIDGFCGCDIITSCCEKNELCYLSSLIDALFLSLSLGYYTEAVKIERVLNDLCMSCHDCPPSLNGMGFQTVNDKLILA